VSDIINQLRTNSECLAPSIMIAAANQIERQNELIATLRQELKEAKARNTMYLSKIQEYEAREQ
jgi:hypothetical protein